MISWTQRLSFCQKQQMGYHSWVTRRGDLGECLNEAMRNIEGEYEDLLGVLKRP